MPKVRTYGEGGTMPKIRKNNEKTKSNVKTIKI